MKIAICDDCLEDIARLKKLIGESESCPKHIEYYEYTSGEELLSDFQAFDGIFLDLQMKGMDGNMTAEKIRQRDSRVLLSFYSGFEASANRILKSHPYSYLLKNSNENECSWELKKFLEELSRRKEIPRLTIKDDGRIFILDMIDVLYISIYNKGSKIWLTNTKAEEIWGKEKTEKTLRSAERLTQYYDRLKEHGFIYGSKSYIINALNVSARLTDSVVLTNGYELNIARSKKKSFDKEFGQYYGEKYNRERVRKE